MNKKRMMCIIIFLFIMPFAYSEFTKDALSFLKNQNIPYKGWSDARKMNLYVALGSLAISLLLFAWNIRRIYQETSITKKELFRQCVIWFIFGALIVWFFRS